MELPIHTKNKWGDFKKGRLRDCFLRTEWQVKEFSQWVGLVTGMSFACVAGDEIGLTFG